MLLLVTLVDAVQMALAEDHLPPVPVILFAIYFRIAVQMFHHLANQVAILTTVKILRSGKTLRGI